MHATEPTADLSVNNAGEAEGGVPVSSGAGVQQTAANNNAEAASAARTRSAPRRPLASRRRAADSSRLFPTVLVKSMSHTGGPNIPTIELDDEDEDDKFKLTWVSLQRREGRGFLITLHM